MEIIKSKLFIEGVEYQYTFFYKMNGDNPDEDLFFYVYGKNTFTANMEQSKVFEKSFHSEAQRLESANESYMIGCREMSIEQRAFSFAIQKVVTA